LFGKWRNRERGLITLPCNQGIKKSIRNFGMTYVGRNNTLIQKSLPPGNNLGTQQALAVSTVDSDWDGSSIYMKPLALDPAGMPTKVMVWHRDCDRSQSNYYVFALPVFLRVVQIKAPPVCVCKLRPDFGP
jgi:hypothetical protein